MGYLKIMEQQLNKAFGSPSNLKGRTMVRHFWGKFYHKCCSHSPAGPKTYHAASWLTDLESKMGRKRLQKWFSCRDTASCFPNCNLWAGCWHLEGQAGRHGDRRLQHHGGRTGFSTTASGSAVGGTAGFSTTASASRAVAGGATALRQSQQVVCSSTWYDVTW